MCLIKRLTMLVVLGVVLFGCSIENVSKENQIVTIGEGSSRGAESRYAIFYEHKDYGGSGVKLYFQEGIVDFTFINNRLNNRVSSIKVSHEDMKINIFQHVGGKGISETIYGSETNLLHKGFNDLLSSIKFVDPNKKAGVITLYNDTNFRSGGHTYREGVSGRVPRSYQLNVESIKITGDSGVVLVGYEKSIYGNPMYLFLSPGEYPDLSKLGFSNMLDAVNWDNEITNNFEKVIVYDGLNYTGNSRQFKLKASANHNFDEVKLWEFGFNDKAKSIRTLNCRVKLYKHGNRTDITDREITGNVNLSSSGLRDELSLIEYLYTVY